MRVLCLSLAAQAGTMRYPVATASRLSHCKPGVHNGNSNRTEGPARLTEGFCAPYRADNTRAMDATIAYQGIGSSTLFRPPCLISSTLQTGIFLPPTSQATLETPITFEMDRYTAMRYVTPLSAD